MMRPDTTPPEQAPVRTAGPKDIAWGAFGALCGALFLLNVLGAVVLLIGGDYAPLLNVAVGLTVTYWFAMGAWRRTVWGARQGRDAPPGPSPHSRRRARLSIGAAVACGVALLVAFAAQLLAARR